MSVPSMGHVGIVAVCVDRAVSVPSLGQLGVGTVDGDSLASVLTSRAITEPSPVSRAVSSGHGMTLSPAAPTAAQPASVQVRPLFTRRSMLTHDLLAGAAVNLFRADTFVDVCSRLETCATYPRVRHSTTALSA